MGYKKLAPSILSADFCHLERQVREVINAGADMVHIDVMDGHFVPNITMGPTIVEALRRSTDKTLDVHLMIQNPERYLAEFAKAGADIISVHVEACVHLRRALELIRVLNLKAGVCLNPSTPLGVLEEIQDMTDMVVLMSVNPGFGGQKYIESSTSKIQRLRKIKEDRGLMFEIEVDGGITPENIGAVAVAGADIVVAGSAIFNNHADVAKNMRLLRAAL